MAGRRRGHPPGARPSPRSGLLLLLVLLWGERLVRHGVSRCNGGHRFSRTAPGTAEAPARSLPAQRGDRCVGEGLAGRGGPPRLGGEVGLTVRPRGRRNARSGVRQGRVPPAVTAGPPAVGARVGVWKRVVVGWGSKVAGPAARRNGQVAGETGGPAGRFGL